MNIGQFKIFLGLCGYDQQGPSSLVRPIGLLAQSGVPSSVTGTTSPTTLATVTIPSGLLGANGKLRVKFNFTNNNSAGTKNLAVQFGGTSVWNTTNTTNTWSDDGVEGINTGILTAQLWTKAGKLPFDIFDTGSGATSAINTANATTLTFVGTLNTITDTLTLTSYSVEVLNP